MKTPLLDYHSAGSYRQGALRAIDSNGYFAVGIRYVHPPRVEWKPVEGAARYELLLLQSGRVLGVTGAAGSPCFIGSGWDRAIPGKAAVVIQAFDSSNRRIALSRMFPFYIVPDFDPRICAERKRPYSEAAERVFTKLNDYVPPVGSPVPTEGPGALIRHKLVLTCTSLPDSYGGYSFPNLHDWMYVDMVDALLPSADSAKKTKLKEFARSVGDHLLMCRLPEQGNEYGGMVRGCVDPMGNSAIGMGVADVEARAKILRLIEPGKCGYSGRSLLRIARITGDAKYMDAAVRIAEVLVSKQLGDGSWPARVDGKTGEVLGTYSTSVAGVARFLHELQGVRPDARYEQARKRAVQWLLDYPVRTYGWVVNFDDNAAPASTVNPYIGLSNWDLFEFVRYLAEDPDAVPDAARVVREQMNWADNHFVFYGTDPLLPFEPYFPTCAEQGNPSSFPGPYACWVPMDFHTANWASALLAAYKVTGDRGYLEKARAAGNALTQYQLDDGSTMTWMCDKTFGLSSQYSGTSGTNNFWQAAWAMAASVWGQLARSE